MKLRPLINNQHIVIDNHHPGIPFKWDWNEGDKIDDIHLDKSMNERVNGKIVKTRVSLNNDRHEDALKKREREDREWMRAYDRMCREVESVLKENREVREQLVRDVILSIHEIGPNKEKRAIRFALMRIARHFGLEQNELLAIEEFVRGDACLYLSGGQKYYAGFGKDNCFYLGQGNGADFSRHVRTSLIEE